MTEKQLQLLDYIAECLKVHRVCPSFDAMRAHMGLKSKSGVHRIITALVERGYVNKRPNRARAISLTNKGLIQTGNLKMEKQHCKCPACGHVFVDKEHIST